MTNAPSQTPLRYLSKTRCWELLRTHDVGRLAVSVDGHPDVFPVNYRVVDNAIIVRTGDGRLLRGALDSLSVAFEVDALNRAARTAWSVVVKGSANEPDHVEDYLRAKTAAVDPWPAGEKDRYLIISVDTVSGRVLAPAVTSVVMTNSSPSSVT